MKSNIFDKNGIEVKISDILIFPYITPINKITNNKNFKKKIIFKYNCFKYKTKTKFKTLMN